MQPHVRQGDLLFIRQDTRPEATLTTRQGNVIVAGEATGHAHRLQAGTIQARLCQAAAANDMEFAV